MLSSMSWGEPNMVCCLEAIKSISNWIKSKKSAILQVPSVHSPYEYNYLLNPMYPDLHIRVLQKRWYLYDNRFLKGIV